MSLSEIMRAFFCVYLKRSGLWHYRAIGMIASDANKKLLTFLRLTNEFNNRIFNYKSTMHTSASIKGADGIGDSGHLQLRLTIGNLMNLILRRISHSFCLTLI